MRSNAWLGACILHLLDHVDQFKVSGKLPTYPSPKLTSTLDSRLGQNDGFGEGLVGSLPETYIDPIMT